MEYDEPSPGPWINCGNHVDNAEGLTILRSFGGFDRLNTYDIRLAATAPELLAALRAIVAFDERPIDLPAELFQEARRVVAKAEGKRAIDLE